MVVVSTFTAAFPVFAGAVGIAIVVLSINGTYIVQGGVAKPAPVVVGFGTICVGTLLVDVGLAIEVVGLTLQIVCIAIISIGGVLVPIGIVLVTAG